MYRSVTMSFYIAKRIFGSESIAVYYCRNRSLNGRPVTFTSCLEYTDCIRPLYLRVQGHPRIAIVLTDGASDNPSLTLAAAKRMHDANIVAFAIGVGDRLNIIELTAIASSPTCTYLILLNSGFAEIGGLISVVEKKACEGKNIDYFVVIRCLILSCDNRCRLLSIFYRS
jgi:von Willebrand factor type A domain